MAVRARRSGEAIAVLPVAVFLVVALAVAYMITVPAADVHTWLLIGDIDAVIALLVAGALIFPAATAFACRIEHVTTPHPVDHFRQSSLLYAAIIVGALALATSTDNRGSLSYGFGGVAVFAALIGIVANALTLTLRGLRARAT